MCVGSHVHTVSPYQQTEIVLTTTVRPPKDQEEAMTTIAVTATVTTRPTFRERMRAIGLALYGPATMGPYGPSTPPVPRPRDHRGRLIKQPQ